MPQLNIKPFVKRSPATQKPRFEVRFVNGQWTIFDRWNFDHGPGLPTEKVALSTAAKLNGGELKWAA